MKKTMLAIAAGALMALFAMPALAAEKNTGPYMSGHLGIAMPSDTTATFPADPTLSMEIEYDPGLALDLALGYKFGPARLEGEIGYQKNDFDDVTVSVAGVGSVSMGSAGLPFSGDVKTTSFLVNGYYDFTNESAFTSYLTAGLGFAKVKASFDIPSAGYTFSDSDTVFAWQIGAGVEYAINQTVSLDVRYRYFATSDPSFDTGGDTIDAEFASHNLMLGAKVKF